MDARQGVRLSWRSIRGHALRSTLTTLGVVIGVAAVIALVTLGTSLQADILGEISNDQASNVYVWVGPPGGNGEPGAGAQPVFTRRDVAELREVAGVASVIPRGVIPVTAITRGNDTVARDAIVATTPSALEDETFAVGRPFRQGERGVVLNPLAARMFGTTASVGDRLTITFADSPSANVTVVGILNSSSGTGPFERFSTLPRVYAPTDPFYESTVEGPSGNAQQRVYPLLTVVADSPRDVRAVKRRVDGYLRANSDARTLKPELYVFEAQTNQEMIDQLQEILNTMTRFITGLAMLSLIVGSIGIANIMLVSVTERTKEIGIMKAVGAHNRDVLQLFLIEAIMLGVLGSVFGTLLGLIGAYAATEYVGLPLVFAVKWIPIAVGIGIAVGAVTGIYPAWSASRVDPIDALRYE